MTTVRVLGGPGTGKTTLLVDAAAAHIAGGADPASVLLLTPGRLHAALRGAVTARLLESAPAELPVVREPLVRSVHGYAFAVLRKAAERADDPPVEIAQRHLAGGDPGDPSVRPGFLLLLADH